MAFKTGIPTNYVAVVEAFGSSRADIGVMNSFGYIMANEKYGASAKLRVIRYGHDYYMGQIIAHVDSGINSVNDIKGKKFAFTDPSSTSGYMFPLKILKDAGVELGNTVFAIKHDNVVSMIYQKQMQIFGISVNISATQACRLSMHSRFKGGSITSYLVNALEQILYGMGTHVN